MILLKRIFQLLLSAPELLKLYYEIEKNILENEKEARVLDDVKAIKNAFKNKDPGALRAVFDNDSKLRQDKTDGI